jgi:hypothetical protein
MAGKLVTLPLRASLGSARLLSRAVSGVAERALAIPGHAIRLASPGRSAAGAHEAAPRPAPGTRWARWHDEPVEAAVTSTSVEHPPAHVTDEPAHVIEEPTDAAEAPAGITEEPAHVTAEPELVRESAEPGAEEGAGAGITVAEPWTGYGRMNARDVVDRVRTATVAELAAMRLYEARHRARRTVLAAVDRQLKLVAGGRAA